MARCIFDQNMIVNQQNKIMNPPPLLPSLSPDFQYLCMQSLPTSVPVFVRTDSPPIYFSSPLSQPQVPYPQAVNNMNTINFMPPLPVPMMNHSMHMNVNQPSANLPLIRMTHSNQLFPIMEETVNPLLDPKAIPFVPTSPSPSPSYETTRWACNHTVTSVRKYCPEFPARAELNIFIHPTMTQMIQDENCQIVERFASSSAFYYYLNISTAMQINDQQINVLVIASDDNEQQILLIHYDLHQIDQKGTKKTLYAVATPNTEHQKGTNKWLWKLEEFLTASQIYEKYGVLSDLLPESSRKMDAFKNKLRTQRAFARRIHPSVARNAAWGSVQQIKKRTRRGGKGKGYGKGKRKTNKLRLSKQQFVKLCMASWNRFPAIPIVVDGNKNGINAHWIEWVVVVDLAQYGAGYIGVTCRYKKNGWMVTSICMDKGDVMNKHRLVGLRYEESDRFREYFNCFNQKYTEIQWAKSMSY